MPRRHLISGQHVLLGSSGTLFCVALLLLVAGPAPATTPTGIDVQDLRAWLGREVTALQLPGLPDHLRATARDGLALTPRSKLLGRRLATLTMASATADARRLRLLLARNGYPDARVIATGEADGQNGVKLTFTVTPGPAVRLGQVQVEGLPPTLTAAADSARSVLASGRPFREQDVQKAREDLLRALRQDGFARPQVEVRLRRPDPATADLVIACQPGHRFVYDQLVIDGAPADLVPLVRRTVSLAPGTPYSPSVIADSRRHLRQLQLFRQVRLQSDLRDSTTLDLVADLRPRAMLSTSLSVGTFTDNWLVVRGGVTQWNFWQRGRGLFVGAAYATYRREAEARTWWPALISARSRTELRLRYEIQDEDAYRLDQAEVALSNLFTRWRYSSLRLGITVSQGVLDNRSADPDAFASDVGLLTLLHGMWYRDTSDDPIDPQRGHRLTLQSEWSPPGFWTESPFGAVRAHGSRYWPLGGSSALAMRLDGAVAWPLGAAEDLRPDRRYFAGGVSSMRGYRRYQLGPADSDGNPIGGEVRLLAGVEARVPVWSIFGVAFFVDTGQVWRYRREVDFTDIQTAIGTGLLLGTPIGPLRLDLARLVDTPAAGQPTTLLQFGIGHPF
jgi:outer membrane protein assembly factor BamA